MPATRIVHYRWKSLNSTLSECGVHARSIAEGVSVVASYGNPGTVHPPFSVSAGVDIDGAARTVYNWRTFDWPWLNGLPSTQLMVTANWNPLDRNPGVTNARYTGVWYTAGRWAVFNQDWWTPMPPNASYNVWAAPPPTPPVVTQ